jgi:type I restriction enzyme, R subunit
MTTTLTPDRHSEAAFESVIEAQLLAHGYTALPSGYDRARALFPDVVTGFIKATQPKEWAKLEALHGANTPARVLEESLGADVYQRLTGKELATLKYTK